MSVCNGLRRACLSILNYVNHFFLKVSEVYLLLLGPSPMIMTDEINPAQLDSVQKLINDSITTMSDNLMAKFSSMFDQYQSRQHNISCTSSSAVPG